MSLINNQQKLTEIIFANRNKKYGAYVIRSAYGNTVFKSLFIVVSTLAMLIGLGTLLRENKTDIKNLIGQTPDIKIIEVKMDEPVEMKKKSSPKADAPKPPENNNTTKATGTEIKINDNAVDTASQKLNTDVTTSVVTTGNGTNLPDNNTGGGGGTGTLTGSPDPYDDYQVDENPEFEGGLNALLQFVGKNLRYPTQAAEIGKQGIVYVKFVVDENGKVGNIILQNNLGYGLDDEAKRVIKMIPNFKSPGKINGKPVKTNYKLPIKFKLG